MIFSSQKERTNSESFTAFPEREILSAPMHMSVKPRPNGQGSEYFCQSGFEQVK